MDPQYRQRAYEAHHNYTFWVFVLVCGLVILCAREILRRRVFEEVSRFNATQGQIFQGLVQPNDTERALNGYKLKKPRQLDWRDQFDKAVQAFDKQRFLMLVGDRQVDGDALL